ncbi:VOC family protein [Amycolatopsis rhabdoformis]|uniref:VOC family protein n=1 Tax=Amycolatopsis rhabdoformis TaxID=1448059 RepID=A0ABZ1IIY7_9PSEU|nr:VOC family protein [Amycolatopsis rhabdoformis]WSE34138.1 VOC family protein [Amycolatopsis rhabdoformis]
MSMHRLAGITLGVPDLEAVGRYYEEFGLRRSRETEHELVFSTTDGGEQLRLVPAPFRRLVAVTIGVDDPDDLGRAAARLGRAAVATQSSKSTSDGLAAVEPVTGVRFELAVQSRVGQTPEPASPVNSPGRIERTAARTPGILREKRVRPRRLGHVVLGSTDVEATSAFITEGIGFKVSDLVGGGHGAFLRCSTDHHNMLVQKAPVNFVHHSAWQVDDIDEVGRGAMGMLEDHPERHVWGLGRHHAGSNFFWYLRDPAGTFSEYYSDLDDIPEDAIWTPEVMEGARGLFNWGPPPPPSFVNPEDLAALMTGAHTR